MLPHNVSDVLLAPVVLHVDARLSEYASMTSEQLRIEIGLSSDKPDRTRSQREAALLTAIAHNQELHGWTAVLDDRGIRLSHADHTLVLGLSASVRDFLDGAAQ